MTGADLSDELRGPAKGPISAFNRYIFDEVIPTFGDLDKRARQVADEYFERMGDQPAGEDFDGDMSYFAEDAQERGLDWYNMMKSLRQTMLNLLTAGLFHLTEQQLGVICRDDHFRSGPLKETKLDEIAKWYAKYLSVDLSALASWPILNELRLVANTVKHGEGKSADELRRLRPGLFRDPAYESFATNPAVFARKGAFAPLAGEDIYVTETILKRYADGMESFFDGLAAHFEAHSAKLY